MKCLKPYPTIFSLVAFLRALVSTPFKVRLNSKIQSEMFSNKIEYKQTFDKIDDHIMKSTLNIDLHLTGRNDWSEMS